MKTLIHFRHLLLAILLLTGFSAMAQKSATSEPSKTNEMKTYLIKRDIPGAGKLTEAELKAISQTSCGVLDEMGSKIQWIHSYVTGDNIFCVYKAENEELIREHGKQGGFPVTEIIEIKTTISPATAK